MAPTPTFSDSFWSPDYAGGIGVLFTKLNQGVQENQQILTIASMRADAEAAYSSSLGAIAPAVDRLNSVGFKRDDGASTRKAYEGVRSEMVEASRNHQKIADNIRELVVVPFGRWCDAHESRVRSSQDDLQGKIKAHDRQADAVKKLRSTYFNKCRLVEDAEEENKLAFQEPEVTATAGSPKGTGVTTPPPKIVVQEEEEEELPVELGDEVYTPEQMKKILSHMLEILPLGEAKVPILGTYQNCSSGTDITDYIQKHMSAGSVGYAEKVGQDLVDRGFLRLVGNVGSTFANSSRMKYQWRPRVWQITGIPEPKKGGALKRSGTAMSTDSILESPVVGNLAEQLGSWNPLVNAHPNETPGERLRRESKEADERYKAGVRKLDLLRCNLEESMMDHFKFLERCELDRLKAIRSVILDFSGAISNSIPSFQSQVDNMMLYQETIQPQGDLRYMLENYRTGGFIPKVTPYENYYGSVDDQTFGVDLEARARADKKRVPLIVTAILTFLDNHYPDLEGDEARRSIWLADVPLAATHHLRNIVNNGAAIPRDVLERYEIPIVASVLKLYLLELPGKLLNSCLIHECYTDCLRLARLVNRLRHHKNNLHNHHRRRTEPNLLRLADLSTAHQSPAKHPGPTPPQQHRHPRRHYHTLHPPHRPHLCRRALHPATRHHARPLHPSSKDRECRDHGRKVLVQTDPRPLRTQGSYLRRAEAPNTHPVRPAAPPDEPRTRSGKAKNSKQHRRERPTREIRGAHESRHRAREGQESRARRTASPRQERGPLPRRGEPDGEHARHRRHKKHHGQRQRPEPALAGRPRQCGRESRQQQ